MLSYQARSNSLRVKSYWPLGVLIVHGSFKGGLLQICAEQARPLELSAVELGVSGLRPSQVRAAHIGLVEITPNRLAALEAAVDQRGAV